MDPAEQARRFQDAQQRRADLERDHSRLGSAMYAVNEHVVLRDLELGTFTGATARTADNHRLQVVQLWALFNKLSAIQADVAARLDRGGRGGEDETASALQLLTGRTVGLTEQGLPVDVVTGPPVEWLTVAELVGRLDQSCTTVAAALDRIERIRHTYRRRLRTMTDAVPSLRGQSATLGLRPDAELDAWATDLTELESTIVNDPLAPAGGGAGKGGAVDASLHRLDQEFEAIRRRFDLVARIRNDAAPRLRKLRLRVAAVAEAEDAAWNAFRAVETKVSEIPAPRRPGEAGRLRAEVGQLEQDLPGRDWPDLDRRLSALESAVDRALGAARSDREAAESVLPRREELRGRLTAYLSVARRLRVEEQSDLVRLFGVARDILWSAPCDLSAAASAVQAYQDAVIRLRDGTEGTRP